MTCDRDALQARKAEGFEPEGEQPGPKASPKYRQIPSGDPS